MVFERWVKAVPGGLIAVVGAITVSWGFDLQAHGVAILGPVPSGLPPLGLPTSVGWNDAMALLPTVGSMFLVIVAQSAATALARCTAAGNDNPSPRKTARLPIKASPAPVGSTASIRSDSTCVALSRSTTSTPRSPRVRITT